MLKQVLVLFMGLLMVVAGVWGVDSGAQTELSNDNFLRIHIRANSNSETDQNVKYLVKDAIVSYLTPKLAYVSSKDEALKIVEQNKDNVSEVANQVLANNGFVYQASTSVKKEDFPTRDYDGVVLPSGEYDSVIVSLGNGTGNNWWCVVYPPLCFVNGENGDEEIVYTSKLWGIIKSIFGG